MRRKTPRASLARIRSAPSQATASTPPPPENLRTAIGRGRPVVVSDVGSLGETVRDFGLGRVVPPGDVHALAEACRRLLGDSDALRAAFEGTRAARAALTWDAAAAEHERVYEDARLP